MVAWGYALNSEQALFDVSLGQRERYEENGRGTHSAIADTVAKARSGGEAPVCSQRIRSPRSGRTPAAYRDTLETGCYAS